ncbi:MAG: adenylate/guanylate cyclase domain-containing protein, partial [Pseudomonadota bacterium]|nr:adenylate/guanylate cyclase domain-containing protein [Pseudomonadota bacterium]
MERRLAAILAADIVGYSRMVGEDEAATLSAIRINLKDVIQPLATRHRGRIVKLMGDGILMEFSSAVDAVVFAVGMQCAMQTRNDCLPDARKVLYRIGINVGDVIFEDGDIFGDGVNIAARLESIAKPGGICIAESAFGQVRGKLKLTFNAQGQRKVKNIAEPVTVWEISVDEHARNIATESADNTQEERSWTIPVAAIIALACIAAGLAWFQFWSSPVEVAGSRVPPATPVGAPVSDKPSIAVLPYVNLSNDKEQEYFSDGLSEDLTTDLSRLSGLIVISRTSSFAYKAQTVDIRTIGRELGARYVLEGSVRRVGERVRINTQ